MAWCLACAAAHRRYHHRPPRARQALGDFAGSAVVVSHDRWFLDRVCTHTLAFEADGAIEFYEGSVSDYAVWKERYRKA